jgi:SnoaL-like polyketide cyclase
MRMNMLNVFAVLILGTTILPMTACVKQGSGSAASIRQEYVDSLRNILNMTVQGRIALDNNLNEFDTLDFKVFTGQEWARLHESHAEDIVVNWPDGRKTTGLDAHIEDLKGMFVYAPDTRITQHPIRFGSASGEWTCVTGIMEGTFTKPMPTGGGKSIQPTGKSFSVSMCTVGKWKDGVMVEEFLFWDNQSFMKQLGLGK